MEQLRTTIRLPADLLKAAKRYALEKDTTFTAIVEEALAEKLALSSPPKPFALISVKGSLQPGVNLDSNAELLDLMEEGLDVASRR